jgi:hypothetical protein
MVSGGLYARLGGLAFLGMTVLAVAGTTAAVALHRMARRTART